MEQWIKNPFSRARSSSIPKSDEKNLTVKNSDSKGRSRSPSFSSIGAPTNVQHHRKVMKNYKNCD